MKNSLLPYCERINTAMEQVNVLSNGGFIAVSLTLLYLFWRQAAQSAKTPAPALSLLTLSLMPALIGLGSAAYHYRPSNITLALDLGPIGLFAGGTLYLCLRYLMEYDRTRAGLFCLSWIAATAIAAPWPGYFFGSLIYVPTLIALSMVAIATRERLIVIASFVFTLALTLRSLDLPLCDYTMTGTHPLWHLFAAVASLLLLLALRKTTQIPLYDQSHQPPQSRTD